MKWGDTRGPTHLDLSRRKKAIAKAAQFKKQFSWTAPFQGHTCKKYARFEDVDPQRLVDEFCAYWKRVPGKIVTVDGEVAFTPSRKKIPLMLTEEFSFLKE